jgi:Asp-tRNA(Asn)/Glu-tRNA(Gln) amidotransferase A subunit family amidase
MIAYASSLDQAGPMAKTAEDCAIMLNAMAGHDAKDSTSLERAKEDYTKALGKTWSGEPGLPLKGLRVGLPKEYFGDGLNADVRTAVDAAVEQLKKMGAECVPVSLPKTELSIPVYYVLAPAEASSNLSRFDGVRYGHRAAEYSDLSDMYKRSRSEGFGAEVKRRIMIGAYVLSHGYYDAYYLKAQRIRRIIAQDFQNAFDTCDIIAGPVAPNVAGKLGEKVVLDREGGVEHPVVCAAHVIVGGPGLADADLAEAPGKSNPGLAAECLASRRYAGVGRKALLEIEIHLQAAAQFFGAAQAPAAAGNGAGVDRELADATEHIVVHDRHVDTPVKGDRGLCMRGTQRGTEYGQGNKGPFHV